MAVTFFVSAHSSNSAAVHLKRHAGAELWRSSGSHNHLARQVQRLRKAFCSCFVSGLIFRRYESEWRLPLTKKLDDDRTPDAKDGAVHPSCPCCQERHSPQGR